MRRYLAAAAVLVAAYTAFYFTFQNLHHHEAPRLSLPQEIDAACKPGYTVTDFGVELDSNLDPVPGLLYVECTSRRNNKYGVPMDSYRTAVQR